MKCRTCRGPAVIDIRRHNAGFCREHFLHHCEEQVRRAIASYKMLTVDDRVLVAVSGGKDSLALWDILQRLGYTVDGLYLGLGIGEYSDESGTYVRRVRRRPRPAARRGRPGARPRLRRPRAAAATRRAPCGTCGLSKRHLFNRAALDGGYDAVATGHNLDDEAAVLFGNVMRWDEGYLGRQHPVLPAATGFVRKVKPLVRLSEREMAAYCVLRGIDYQVEECPMAAGNKHLGYKELLNGLEEKSPGSKAAFLFGFLDRGHDRFADHAAAERDDLGACSVCGAPTPVYADADSTPVCAFCRLQEKASARVSVELRAPHTRASS